MREALPPTIFFFVGFNFIVLTTNLLVAQYLVAVSNFMLATVAALVVGKAVLVANKMPLSETLRSGSADPTDPVQDRVLLGRRVFRAPARAFCAFLRSRAIRRAISSAYLITTFSWHRFSAISLWILVLFLIYVTASEFSHLFGPGEMRRLFFTSPAVGSAAQSATTHARALAPEPACRRAFGRANSAIRPALAHRELIEIVQRLARQSAHSLTGDVQSLLQSRLRFVVD